MTLPGRIHMHQRFLHHLPQFLRYLASGSSAAALELGSYKLMLLAGVWYLAAAFISAGIGLVSAFAFHKYFVFKKKENTRSHIIRYAILQGANALAQVSFVYIFVEFFSIDEFIAKILGIGIVVSWNFFLYKIFVYV